MSGPDGTNPDPFCQFEMPAKSLATATISRTIPDTFTPVWNVDMTPASGPIKAQDLLTKSWRLWIGDDDGCTPHACFGQEICEIGQPNIMSSDFLAGQISLQNVMSCQSLTVKLVCRK
jgi:hypothetical protein